MAYDRKIINDLDFQNVQKVKNAVDPTADQDYATKKYVDDNVSSGGAPADATYITQVAEAGLSAEQALSALATGILKVTTGTGVLSTATADTDYVKDIGVVTHAATGKTTPVDADEMPISDSAASNVLKKVSLTDLKAFLKTYFDTLYTASGGAAPIGTPELIYRYTVTGSDKASIDTGVDTADAGSNDWTNGDLLEVQLYARTDEAAALSGINVTFNNDGSSIYDRSRYQVANTTVSGAVTLAAAALVTTNAGASAAAGVFGMLNLLVPNFAGTVGWKIGHRQETVLDTAAANTFSLAGGFQYRSTSAISRLAVTPSTAGKKLKVGSQLVIYKRRSA